MPIGDLQNLPASSVGVSPLTGQRREYMSRYSPQQLRAQNQLLQQALGGLQDLGDFSPIEERARQQFEQRTVPSLAERFTSLGGQRSSAFQQALGQAGSDLESQLAAQRGAFGLQRAGALQSLLQMGMQPQYEVSELEQQPGFSETFFPQLGQAAGQIIPQLIQMYLQNRMQGNQQEQGASPTDFFRQVEVGDINVPAGMFNPYRQRGFGQRQQPGQFRTALKGLLPAAGTVGGSFIPGVGPLIGGAAGSGLAALL